MVGSVDYDYQKKAFEYNQAQSNGALTWRRGHFQPTKYAFIQYFKSGAMIGALGGILPTIYYRKIMLAPQLSVATGITCGTVMAISQLYRHEI